MTTRWLELQGAANTRVVVDGVLIRSDSVRELTEVDVRRLIVDYGLVVVLDLRTDREIALDGAGALRSSGVRVRHCPLFDDLERGPELADDTLWPHPGVRAGADPVSTFVETYFAFLRCRPDSVVAAAATVAGADGAVLVHCAAGKDRTGVVVALLLDAAGVDRDSIEDDYLATAERMDDIFALLARSDAYRTVVTRLDPSAQAPRAGTIRRLLELVDEQFGGSAAWLLSEGLSPGDLRSLRARVRGNAGVSGPAVR